MGGGSWGLSMASQGLWRKEYHVYEERVSSHCFSGGARGRWCVSPQTWVQLWLLSYIFLKHFLFISFQLNFERHPSASPSPCYPKEQLFLTFAFLGLSGLCHIQFPIAQAKMGQAVVNDRCTTVKPSYHQLRPRQVETSTKTLHCQVNAWCLFRVMAQISFTVQSTDHSLLLLIHFNTNTTGQGGLEQIKGDYRALCL